MNFKALVIKGQDMGWYHESEGAIFFFGSALLDTSHLKTAFPDLSFREVHQVHGNKVVPSSLEKIEADGHWTDDEGIALLIKTADCMPILIEQNGRVCALHAGWRGVLSNIFESATEFLSTGPIRLACGPHIQGHSFEVDMDVFEKFNAVLPSNVEFVLPGVKPTKFHLDLQAILKWQIQFSGLQLRQAYFSSIDTVTDVRFHSYRRDKDKVGRNYSFVARRSR